MPFNWNVFRVLADIAHTASKCILIWAIHSNKSAEGVSLITQLLYLAVFSSRYLFINWGGFPNGFEWHLAWNDTLRVFYILSSAYIVLLMMKLYARTREREKAWKLGIGSLAGSLGLAPFTMMIFLQKQDWSFSEFCITFSLILESVCVLPQLLLLRQTTVPTVIDSFYLVTLGSYRAFYLLNWLFQIINRDSLPEPLRRRHPDPISIIFGLIQTALYVDFAWVYWTRQRVKLRGGTIVDSEDMDKGWLVTRLIGRKSTSDDVEDTGAFNHQDGTSEDGPSRRTNNWGARGISVSADDHDDLDQDHPASRLTDPTAFEDDDDRDEPSRPPSYRTSDERSVGNGEEWRDNKTIT
ncbi:MAG: hypothetical protein M1828_003709 [Chrysothrix sp. TS-e1954]|nr:MAG: hypothetical protein M1828_003709 [Chrysothrix sp. TS-e1954]